jgi:hypothetical protein
VEQVTLPGQNILSTSNTSHHKGTKSLLLKDSREAMILKLQREAFLFKNYTPPRGESIDREKSANPAKTQNPRLICTVTHTHTHTRMHTHIHKACVQNYSTIQP